tara:strand:- start:493 stop:615 length:123 start_codon:yes stop_codon:yes gene_type:complete
MEEVQVVSEGVEYVYEFDNYPTQEQIDSAMDTIGGRPKRP